MTNDKVTANIQHEIDKVALTLHRLNNMWSFTGKQLAYAADNYLHLHRAEPLDRIYDLVYAYAAVTKSVTHLTERGMIIPDEWNRLFGNVGQSILFTLPELLNKKLERDFDKAYAKYFVKAWGESPLPCLSL